MPLDVFVCDGFADPKTTASELTVLDFISQLLVPMVLLYILLFFFVFECVLNCIAELLRFEERQFYEDWWNR
jgi:sterol O-acyltransferase